MAKSAWTASQERHFAAAVKLPKHRRPSIAELARQCVKTEKQISYRLKLKSAGKDTSAQRSHAKQSLVAARGKKGATAVSARSTLSAKEQRLVSPRLARRMVQPVRAKALRMKRKKIALRQEEGRQLLEEIRCMTPAQLETYNLRQMRRTLYYCSQ